MLQTEALAASRDVKGWLSEAEQALLYDLARAVPAVGTIVELGSWMGRSTIMLAAGSLAGPRAMVFAVDLFANVGATSAEYAPYLESEDPDYFGRFEANIREARVESIVSPLRGTTVDGASNWIGPAIDLLFIDADHSIEGVRADFLAWAPRCACGARIAFHDYFNMNAEGVHRFVDQLISAGVLDEVGFADSILYARLRVNDRAVIESRLRFPILGLPRLLFRPAGERVGRSRHAVARGWSAFNRGNRHDALRNAVQSIWWSPFSGDVWKLLICSITKPVESRP